MHFQYAFLIAHKKYAFSICIFDGSKIFPKYAFFHGKMHMFVYFLAGCRKRLLVLDCPSQRFAEYAFLMVPRFFRNLHFFMGKCIHFLLFGWLQKMHIPYFVDFVQKPRFSLNYAFLMAPRFS